MNIRSLFKISLCIIAFSFGCNKTIESPILDAYTPATLDETGGGWKTIVVTDVTTLQVAAPNAVTSTEYTTELQNVRSLQAGRTEAQENAVKYWNAGAVNRWNEIARELAARYNLPPAVNPDGTYPVPDAANPTNYPKFPFANPPYASRMFAYLGVAQYDALVANWHFKYQYNRPAPSVTDTQIESLKPSTSAPSYPSDDAVVAAASLAVLKAMFPGEVAYLEAKAQEHCDSRLWAGTNTQSDIDAGKSLGAQVATKVIDRSKTDGMKMANNQTLVPALIANAQALGISTTWTSLDAPARPPMLPGFGLVAPWNFEKSIVPSLRPPLPPAIGSEKFNKDIAEVRSYSDNLSREEQRIASFWADGPGSYTPAGHWNRIASELAFEGKMNELRFARTMALTATAVADAGICCWDVKYNYYFPRPSQVDSKIKTTVGVPNFPSYTSGHSTFSAAGATVLGYIFPNEKARMDALAKEASESRIYGCIHYRFDCEAGLECGKNIAIFAVERGKADGSPQ